MKKHKKEVGLAFSKPQNKSVAELGFEFGFIWAPTGSLRTLHLLCAHEVTVVMTSCLLILGRDQMKLVPRPDRERPALGRARAPRPA